MPTDFQKRQEKAITLAIVLDLMIVVPYFVLVVLTGSISMLAEILRGVLLLVTEALGLHTLRRIHRGKTGDYDYGLGKTERAISGAVGALLVVAAAFVVYKLVTKVPAAEPSAFLAILSTVAVIGNLMTNVLPLVPLWRASREEPSVTLVTQLRARAAKALSSVMVVICVAISLFSDDRALALVADSVGGLVGAGFMTVIGVGLIRDMLPDLLDRALAEPVQIVVNRALAAFFDEYDELEGVRTRRAGSVPHIEITIRFAPERSMGEIHGICERMRAALRQSIPGADVVIVALSRTVLYPAEAPSAVPA